MPISQFFMIVVTLIVLSACAGAGASSPVHDESDDAAASAEPLRVMSFNIRYPNPDDGKNVWPNRRDLVVETIKDFGPDVLGVQEAYRGPADYILNRLDGYKYIGVGREDGKDKGEMTAIYYNTERFEPIHHGHFWLSDTPETVGSVGWDASLTRMATWVVLKDKPTDQSIIILNTHFDHRGAEARRESAALIRRRAARLVNAFDAPAIVMGDFNAPAPGSAPYKALMGEGEDEGAGGIDFVDTYLAIHAESDDPAGTFNGFRGRNDGARIDWIVVTDDLQVRDAGIDRSNDHGRYPSDHYPVTAVLRLSK